MFAREHAEKNPDRPALIMAGSGEVVTFAQFEAAADRLAHFFRDVGLRRLDHVAFLMENNPRLLECEGAAERTGLYYTCVNTHLSADEVAYIVNDCQARVVITSAFMRDVAAKLPGLCPNVERWLMVDTDEPPVGYERYAEVVAGYPAEPVPDERLGAVMLYSSGTTGRPKGILRQPPDVPPAVPLDYMEPVRVLNGLREGMVYLSPAPLYFGNPQVNLAGSLRLAGTAVIMERFDAVQFLELVERYRVTTTQMVPTMFSRLLKLPEEVRRSADVSSLEWVGHSAAPCPIPVKEQMIDWFGPIIREAYGSTEGVGSTFCTSEEWLAHKGTVGRPYVGEILILDDAGNPCPAGTVGTIWHRGGTNFEYFNDKAKTAEVRVDTDAGVMSTVGDVGYLDEDGYLYLTDRKTYMIISGGVNIYPQETENLLITHPKVFDAAVIGVPNEDFGEEVKAVVQPAPGIAPGLELEQELIAFCRDNIAHYKCPRSVDFVDELPRLPTGKLYKRLLRDKYWKGRATSIV